MKQLLFILFAMFCTPAFSQETKDSVVYRYIIAEPQGALFSNKCYLYIDDGITKPAKKKSEKKNYLTFKSFAAALMYLTSQGWELVTNYGTVSGSVANGYGSSSSSTFWILRRPSTKEEVNEIINNSLIKEED